MDPEWAGVIAGVVILFGLCSLLSWKKRQLALTPEQEKDAQRFALRVFIGQGIFLLGLVYLTALLERKTGEIESWWFWTAMWTVLFLSTYITAYWMFIGSGRLAQKRKPAS